MTQTDLRIDKKSLVFLCERDFNLSVQFVSLDEIDGLVINYESGTWSYKKIKDVPIGSMHHIEEAMSANSSDKIWGVYDLTNLKHVEEMLLVASGHGYRSRLKDEANW